MKNRIWQLAAFFVLVLLLGGCTIYAPTDLYTLPQPSEEYLQLQSLLNNEIAAGSEYAAPTGGNYRQSVQFYDLDQDGQEEVLAFFRDEDLLPFICIYENSGETYTLALTIQGVGSSISRVEYAELDGSPGTELVVVWNYASDLRLLRVYSLSDNSSSVLLEEREQEFTVADLDGDGRSELLTLYYDDAGNGTLHRHSFSRQQEVLTETAPLTQGLVNPSRFRTSTLYDGMTALFVEGTLVDGTTTVTDIFAMDNDIFRNITYRSHFDSSTARREYAVYAADVNGDKRLEIPMAFRLPTPEDAETAYWVYDWYGFHSNGSREFACSTYHCVDDGWYLILPEVLRQGLQVRRETTISGVRTVVLSSLTGDGTVQDMLVIDTLTGENRQERAKLSGRFLLREDDTSIYTARLPEGSTLLQEDVSRGFRLIYNEWNIGTIDN